MKKCPECKEPIDYWQVDCRCGRFVGYPTRRMAERKANRRALSKRRNKARRHCRKHGVEDLLDTLRKATKKARPVIATPFEACDNILRDKKYRNYYQRVLMEERAPAKPTDHGNRTMVAGKLFPTYHEKIVYAALSPDSTGLTSYGEVMIRWEVTPSYLKKRIVLLEENSYDFFGQHGLGDRDVEEPPGYRAIWEDRGKLSVAKIGPKITPSTSHNDIPSLLMQPGPDRGSDDFIEVAIYADRGLDTQDVSKVTVQRPALSRTDRDCYHRIKDFCHKHDIEFRDSSDT